GDTEKVLMVHGVGTHVPGYSTQFQEKLSAELRLVLKSSRYKEIKLTHNEYPGVDLGVLRVRRLMNEDHSREMLFYELTWSAITNSEKEKIKYDTSGEYSYDRAEVNQLLKQFSNDASPDPMIYLGKSRGEILASFRTAFCWMVENDWASLPETSSQSCKVGYKSSEYLQDDEFSIISHSLGSRIVIDGMHDIAKRVTEVAKGDTSSAESKFITAFQNKQIPFYLMSNQIPLLEMGEAPPEVTGEADAYCLPGGEHYGKRLVKKTSIMAFSDPNDLLSYGIPQSFVENYLDSRLCAEVTNITINVAHVMDLFGMGKFANPLTAHTGYDSDDRVVALIAKGIGTKHTADIVVERCDWTEYID
ncbi:MAG: hypothetical protein PSN04_02775, partial [Methyloprofundus sp.]|nr:hypothetical protein [Methyloprofundus sp.]